MALSNTIKIALASATGALVVSSTVLFPLIKDINKSISEEKVLHTPTDSESNKTVQVISKNQNYTEEFNTSAPSLEENPSLNTNTVSSTNDPKMRNSDTFKSKLLIEDIPHSGRN